MNTKNPFAERRRKEFSNLPLPEKTLVKQISCTGCGACCSHMRSPPHIVLYENDHPVLVAKNGCESFPEDYEWLMAAPDEARRIKLERLNADYEEFPDECPCCWLDLETKQCRFYEFRPGICRDFEMGSEACHEHRKLLEIE